jgi:hypothetical protein
VEWTLLISTVREEKDTVREEKDAVWRRKMFCSEVKETGYRRK